MSFILTTIQVISAILLITLILLQQRGTGLGSAFGGGGEIFQVKRGVEKIIFIATIIIAIIFFASILAKFIIL